MNHIGQVFRLKIVCLTKDPSRQSRYENAAHLNEKNQFGNLRQRGSGLARMKTGMNTDSFNRMKAGAGLATCEKTIPCPGMARPIQKGQENVHVWKHQLVFVFLVS